MWRFQKAIFSTMWIPRNRRVKTDAIEMQEGRSLVRSLSSPEDGGNRTCVRAHRARYLGHLPVPEASGTDCTEKTVSKLLDKAAREYTDLDYIYIDVQPTGLVYYQVDHNCRVTEKQTFNISRISYCSADHEIDPCVFAWIYHQETPSGKGLECHAVRMRNERRAKILAVQLQQAFHALFKDVQAALESSKMFNAAITKKLKIKREEDEGVLLPGGARRRRDLGGASRHDIAEEEDAPAAVPLPQPDLVPIAVPSTGDL